MPAAERVLYWKSRLVEEETLDLINVNRETCSRCGACAAVCPDGLIEFTPKTFPNPSRRAELLCLSCGHCVAVCPRGSLSHRYVPLESCAPLNPDLAVNPEQCRQLLTGRRSVRRYQRKPVPREEITRLIEIARHAPTGHNNQEVEWLVLDKRSELQQIEEAGTGWLKWNIANQPKYAALLNMEGTLERQAKRAESFLRGAPALVVATAAKDNRIALIDSSIALSFLDLAAQSHGLGCCWAGLVYAMAQSYAPVQKIIALPEGEAVYGCMMLGYPQYRYFRIPARKEARILWH
jgi:nitroreductase/Pyruvate/2-oxoacid:ferredoxin oxidoreductase delta subunit